MGIDIFDAFAGYIMACGQEECFRLRTERSQDPRRHELLNQTCVYTGSRAAPTEPHHDPKSPLSISEIFSFSALMLARLSRATARLLDVRFDPSTRSDVVLSESEDEETLVSQTLRWWY
jgi:hypothetical protein